MPFIARGGDTGTITVPSGQSLIVGSFGAGVASIHIRSSVGNAPQQFRQLQTLTGGSVTLGPYASPTDFRIFASLACDLEYAIGTAPGLSDVPLTAAQVAAGATNSIGSASDTTAVAPSGAQFKLNRVQAGINGYAHVANRCNIAANTSTGAVKTTSRVTFTTVGACSDLRLVFTNTITNSAGGEADATATITVSGAIEYPVDTILPVTFNGATTASIPPGCTVVSDPVGVDVPAATNFWTRQCVTGSSWPLNLTTVANASNGGKAGDCLGSKITGATNANPIVITTSGNHNLTSGDSVTIAGVGGNTAANVTGSTATVLSATTFSIPVTGNGAYTSGGYVLGGDLTQAGSGAMLTSGGVNTFCPIAVVGVPLSGQQAPWVAIFGDSIAAGSGDTSVSNGGWVVRALGGPAGCTVPFVNLARAGTRASQFVDATNMQTQSIRRRRLGMGAPYTISNYGTNDIYSGLVTLATMQSNALSIATSSWRRGGRHILAAVLPQTTSSDSWATATNQATKTGETVRTAYNDWIRAGCPIDQTTKAAVAIGTSGALLAGSNGHPVWMTVDPTVNVEVNASNVLTVNGGFWITNGSGNYPTTDGTHPTSALAAIIAASFDATKLVAFA